MMNLVTVLEIVLGVVIAIIVAAIFTGFVLKRRAPKGNGTNMGNGANNGANMVPRGGSGFSKRMTNIYKKGANLYSRMRTPAAAAAAAHAAQAANQLAGEFNATLNNNAAAALRAAKIASTSIH